MGPPSVCRTGPDPPLPRLDALARRPKQIHSKADYQEERGWTTFARGGAAVKLD
jgi:hypothetical protein